MNDKEPQVNMRRLHGRAIERAYQTGDEPMVCTHHDEESYYSIEKTNVQPKGEKDEIQVARQE